MSVYIVDEIFFQQCYDYNWSQSPDLIIDVGANIGLFMIRAKQLYPSATIICYEPAADNFAALQRVIYENNIENVSAVCAAFAAHRGTSVLYQHPKNMGGHSTVHAHSGTSTVVPTETVEDALMRASSAKVVVIKLDCEGAERQVLLELPPQVTDRLLGIVYEPDWRAYSVSDVNAHLQTFGYGSMVRGDVVFCFKTNGERPMAHNQTVNLTGVRP
jgi:FkbM family methyltransferase